jgi:GH25 family lysozyme M1 (1,4-beta-N-acetylmuramidase)
LRDGVAVAVQCPLQVQSGGHFEPFSGIKRTSRGRHRIDPAVKGAIMLDKAVVDLSHWDEVDSFEDAKDDGVVGIIHKATESNNYFDPTYNGRPLTSTAS